MERTVMTGQLFMNGKTVACMFVVDDLGGGDYRIRLLSLSGQAEPVEEVVCRGPEVFQWLEDHQEY